MIQDTYQDFPQLWELYHKLQRAPLPKGSLDLEEVGQISVWNARTHNEILIQWDGAEQKYVVETYCGDRRSQVKFSAVTSVIEYILNHKQIIS